MKTSELVGVELDYWVWRACGGPHITGMAPMYSTDWAHGGLLIEKHKIEIVYNWNHEEPDWTSGMNSHSDKLMVVEWGQTPLQAICRAVVRSVFGDEVNHE